MELNVRSGVGFVTEFSYDPNIEKYSITLGQKMVLDCIESYKNSIEWMHGLEILQRGYFNKEISIQNILASAALHEFAHFLTYLKHDNSIHNEDFYDVLDYLHHDNVLIDGLLEFLNKDPLLEF